MELATTVASSRSRTGARRRGYWWLLAGLLVFAAALTAYNPPGYFGGRWDDGRYLEAAIAWADGGPQLGPNHWSLRWPVVLPAAAMIELFGRTRAALMIPGLLTYFGLIALNFAAARRVFGVAVAAVAAFALITTDVVFGMATRITADLPEALFWTAAVWAFVFAVRGDGTRQRNWLIAAGAAAGLAFATRETGASLVIAGGVAFLAGVGPARARYLWIAAGFLAVLLPEQLLLGSVSGDWLYRLHTDLHHIEIPSTNLAGLVAPHAFAPMNADLMGRWLGAGPVHWWWVTDTWTNLFLNGEYGLDFVVAALGCALLAGRARSMPVAWRTIGILAALAATQSSWSSISSRPTRSRACSSPPSPARA